MTASELKNKIVATGKAPFFFTRNNMKFAGDTMKNFGVRSTEYNGVECWELYRKHPTIKGFSGSFYWNKETFTRVH